jgi:hypothetical protein
MARGVRAQGNASTDGGVAPARRVRGGGEVPLSLEKQWGGGARTLESTPPRMLDTGAVLRWRNEAGRWHVLRGVPLVSRQHRVPDWEGGSSCFAPRGGVCTETIERLEDDHADRKYSSRQPGCEHEEAPPPALETRARGSVPPSRL